MTKYPNAGIILMGDFNRFNYRNICNNFNFRQIVKNPTRGSAILDLIITNLSGFYDVPEILPGIGLSDHNSFFTRPLIKAHKAKAQTAYRRFVKPSVKLSFGTW